MRGARASPPPKHGRLQRSHLPHSLTPGLLGDGVAATTLCVRAKPDARGGFDRQGLQGAEKPGERGPQSPPSTATWGSVFHWWQRSALKTLDGRYETLKKKKGIMLSKQQ